MTVYRLDGLKKVFDRRTVVDIAHLELDSGRVYALIGPNGAGKTTLLDLLAFLERPTSGSISFMGRTVSFAESHLKVLRRSVVLVNQKPILFSTSVFKNLEFGLKIRRITKAQRVRIIHKSLDLLGMRYAIAAPAHRLSGGETQRVALARALALSPKIILCDEPCSSVDLESQTAVIQLLKRVNEEEGITIVLTSHNQAEVGKLAHRSLFIDRGKISDALHENLFPAEFVREHNGTTVCIVANSLRVPVQSDRAGKGRVLIHPQQIEVSQNRRDGEPYAQKEGRILQISLERETVRIVLDVGIQLTATTTMERYRALSILVGDKVPVFIGRSAVNPL